MKKLWTIELVDGKHTVELQRSWFTGRHRLQVDDSPVELQRPRFFDLGGDHPFSIGGHAGVLHIRTNGLTFSYDLSIDNRSAQTGQAVAPLAPIPKWAWLFVALCVAVPLVTLGGAVPALVGALGAVACTAIARNATRSTLTRVALNVGVTALTWVATVLFVGAITGSLPQLITNRPASAWKEFSTAVGGFSILMPGTPQEQKQSLDSEIGPIDYYTFSSEDRASAYVVGYADYPADLIRQADPDAMLDGARDGAVSNVKGKLVNEREMSLRDYPGKELEIEAPIGGVSQNGTIITRLYLVDQRLYQLITVTPQGRDSSEDVQKFLDSFKLLDR